MKVFQNYHRHAMYTNVRISDSAVTPKDYAERAKALGHGILSSAEHGWQGNYFETVRLAKEYGLKPLIGAEAYWVKDRAEKDLPGAYLQQSRPSSCSGPTHDHSLLVVFLP